MVHDASSAPPASPRAGSSPAPVLRQDLVDQFGEFVEIDGPTGRTARDIVGATYRSMLHEVVRLVAYQWRSSTRRSPIKGFLLAGPPGTGKTTLVRRAALELARLFPGGGGVDLYVIDGGHIARAKYGESEERIRSLFLAAGAAGPAGSHAIILLDDVESILMRRGSDAAREWHFAQDSVFFHVIDELDTSRQIVFLTTNRPELVDDAILDRFQRYDLDGGDPRQLVEVLRRRCAEYGIPSQHVRALEAAIEAADPAVRLSFRDVDRLAMKAYVSVALGSEGGA